MFAPLDVSTLAANWAAVFAAVALKGIALLALAWVGSMLLRRAAASTRHLVWTAAVVGLLALPLLELVLPRWELDAWSFSLPADTVDATHAVDDASATPFGGTVFLRTPDRGRPAADGTAAMPALRSLRHVIEEPTAHASAKPPMRPWNAFLDAARGWSPWTWLLLAWELGALLVFARLVTGWIGLRRLEARCRPVHDADWTAAAEVAADEMGLRRVPALLETDDAMTPLVWGVRHPKVLVPAGAFGWSLQRRIDVLRHEFAHVQRRDVLTQWLAQIACAIFWFHPLPWLAASRMRLERERACDDRVLLAGSRASSYATHLLEMARTLRSEHGLAAASIGMARRSQLGERMDSLLDDAPRGRATSRAQRAALTLLAVGLVLPLAALGPAALEAAPPEDEKATTVFRRLPTVVERSPGTVPSPPAPDLVPRGARVAVGLRGTAPQAPSFPDAPVVVESSNFSFSNGTHQLTQNGNAVFGADEVVAEHVTWRMKDGDLELEVEMDGRFRFADDDTDVEIVGDEGYFDLYWEDRRERRRMEIERDEDGTVTRRYTVRGREEEIDETAREWFADAVRTFAITAGVGVEARVDRWVAEYGPLGAMDRIEEIEFEHPAVAHWSALLAHDGLDEEQRAELLDRVEREVDSDFLLNRFLGRSLVFLATEPGLADETIALIDALDSDFERGRAIRMALELDGIDADLAERILILADGMDSDFEKARVLIPGARLHTGSVGPSWFRVLDGVDSDFEKTRALIEALPLALDDAEARASMWNAIEDIDSDFEKARIVTALASRLDTDEMVVEALAVIDGIDSDFEKARALAAFVDAAAASDTVREEFTRVADRIDSDHEYGRLMRRLEAAGR